MSDLVSLETEPLRTELAREWKVICVGLAVIDHIATFGRFIGTVQAFKLLVKPVRLRVAVVCFHKLFL